MALNAVEQVSEQVPADDFQALEEKVYRTIEMFKAAREARLMLSAMRNGYGSNWRIAKRNWSGSAARPCN